MTPPESGMVAYAAPPTANTTATVATTNAGEGRRHRNPCILASYGPRGGIVPTRRAPWALRDATTAESGSQGRCPGRDTDAVPRSRGFLRSGSDGTRTRDLRRDRYSGPEQIARFIADFAWV